MGYIFIIHVFCTFFMTGLCWFVQLVHYPLFRHVGTQEFPNYERRNMLTGVVAIPTMVVELLTGIWLYLNWNDQLFLVNLGFICLVVVSTFTLQVPMHIKLMDAANSKLITKLIRTNWIRTISWTIRSILLIYILIDVMPSWLID